MGIRDELEEKDAEIARLKAQLDAKEVDEDLAELERMEAEEREHAPPPSRERPTRARAKSKDTRETWAFDTHMPYGWLVGVVGLAVGGGGAWYARAVRAMPWTDLWPALFVFATSLIFFHQHGLVLDKRAGTVTRKDRLLLFSWKRVRTYAGKVITVDRRAGRRDGESYWVGHVFLGDLKLFAKKEEESERLAKQVADFLGIPCRSQSSAKQAQRLALLPLVLTAIFAVIFVVVFVLREAL